MWVPFAQWPVDGAEWCWQLLMVGVGWKRWWWVVLTVVVVVVVVVVAIISGAATNMGDWSW
jgi:hypothetical protein